MRKSKSIKALLIGLFIGQLGVSQAIENGAIFEVLGGSIIKGELFESDTTFKIRLSNETVVSLKKNGITKSYMPDEINLFANGNFNYKKGFLVYLENGFSGFHYRANLFGAYLLDNGIEFGLGIGYHRNALNIPASNSFTFIEVNSYPIYASGKYFLLQNTLKKPYVKASFGYSNNKASDWANVANIKNSVMFEAGVGVAFSSKAIGKWYLEVLQYNLHAKGESYSFNPNSLGNIGFDVWFNRIVFNFGVFIGK